MTLAAFTVIGLWTLVVGGPTNADDCAEFDKGTARLVLASVDYKSCPGSGSGWVQATFAPKGHVLNVVTTDGVAGNTCIENRFKLVRVPSFCPPAKVVAWRVELP